MPAEELQPARAVDQNNVGLDADLLATLVAASVKPGGADCRDKAAPPYLWPLWHGQERAIGRVQIARVGVHLLQQTAQDEVAIHLRFA